MKIQINDTIIEDDKIQVDLQHTDILKLQFIIPEEQIQSQFSSQDDFIKFLYKNPNPKIMISDEEIKFSRYNINLFIDEKTNKKIISFLILKTLDK